MINLQRELQYKNGTQISKLLGKFGREELKELKPYTELTKEQGVEIMSIIVEGLSSKATGSATSKQELGNLFLEEHMGEVDNTQEPQEENTTDKDVVEEQHNAPPKATPIATPKKPTTSKKGSVTQQKALKDMEQKISEQDKKIEEMYCELKAIRKLLEISNDLK